MPTVYSNINNQTAEQKVESIRKNFDFMTSEAYYAGSDEFLDSVFIGKRQGNKLFLVNRPLKSFSVFTTIFRGKIITDGDNCFIKGYFSKRYFDYIIYLLLSAFVLIFAVKMQDINQSGGLMIAIIWGIVTILFLMPLKGTKTKYIDFLNRVVNFIN